MKNPNFNREELILCLDLYFKLDYGQMHKGNAEIIQLSKDLKNLNIHKEIPNQESFRSPSSVALKLANLMRFDKNFSGIGMRMGGSLEREIWKEFQPHKDRLKKEADIIRQVYLQPKFQKTQSVKEPNVSYKSDFTFQYHKNRETDPLVIKIKKELVLTEFKKMKCEVCGFDSVSFYGEIGYESLEIHYHKELKNLPGLESSDMKDFIIVCSNCHKVLDKNYGLLDVDDLKEIIHNK
jgi:5-methylcytosine-specific restriction protein A